MVENIEEIKVVASMKIEKRMDGESNLENKMRTGLWIRSGYDTYRAFLIKVNKKEFATYLQLLGFNMCF